MVLGRVINFGIPRGYSDSNAAEKTEKIPYEAQPFKPWTDWAFDLFFTPARLGLHLPIYSALFTGQRSVDVIPMMRPKREAKTIELIARKTGEQVWVPIHSEYREAIEVTRTENVRLHLREDGEAWTVAGYRTAWQREMTFGLVKGGNDTLCDEAARIGMERGAPEPIRRSSESAPGKRARNIVWEPRGHSWEPSSKG